MNIYKAPLEDLKKQSHEELRAEIARLTEERNAAYRALVFCGLGGHEEWCDARLGDGHECSCSWDDFVDVRESACQFVASEKEKTDDQES